MKLHYRSIITILTLILPFLFLWCSCNKEITGDVFIVTQGAGAYKLALTEVSVFDAQTFEHHIVKMDNCLFVLRDSTNSKINHLSHVRLQPAIERLHKAENLRVEAIFDDVLEIRAEKLVRKMEDGIQNILNEIYLIRTNYPMAIAALLIKSAPMPLLTTKTDADGHFTVRLRAGKEYIFYAQEKRQVIYNAEYYAWLIKMTVPRRSSYKVVLSNDNLIGIDSSVVNWRKYSLSPETGYESTAKIILNSR